MNMDINFNKSNDGLVPAIIQDATTKNVLMLGYMDQQAYQKTVSSKLVTFFGRTKQRLWTKGEESGNYLHLVDIKLDCDKDTLLIKAKPAGPTCHKGTDTCWKEDNEQEYGFLSQLEEIIRDRKDNEATEDSYVASLFNNGINKIAQKVGEEAVELIIEAKDNDDDLFLNEGADLLFHYLILLSARGYRLNDIVQELWKRHR
jgi:phosphoribosyl-ATP pyrophosphohydrolase/phosphoribosyl-AMP cyclohydrolase